MARPIFAASLTEPPAAFFDCRSHLLHTDTSIGGTLLGFARRTLNELTGGLGTFISALAVIFLSIVAIGLGGCELGSGKMASLCALQ
jgi:hypothetical protein